MATAGPHSAHGSDLPVTCGWDEVDAGVDSGVRDSLFAVDEDLFLQITFILFVDIFVDRLPAMRRVRGGDFLGFARQLFSDV